MTYIKGVLAFVTAGAFYSPAHAGDTAIIGEPQLYFGATVVRMQPTEEPGAAAEIIFHNVEVNNPNDAGGYTVTLGDMTAQVTFGFNTAPGGQDSITVTPPAGFIAVPETLTLMEGATGVVLLYSAEMM